MINIDEQDHDARHLSSVVSISRDEAICLREHLAQFIVAMRTSVLKSPAEELYCLNTDFFMV